MISVILKFIILKPSKNDIECGLVDINDIDFNLKSKIIYQFSYFL